MRLFGLENSITLSAVILFAVCDYVSCLDTVQKINEHGYPLKTYKIWTPDKYLLGIERIPFSKHGNGAIGRPVLLLHGLFTNSVVFTLNNSSLSFVLSDAGFDVWLFNSRGAGLSRKLSIYNNTRTPKMTRISWDFSFDEMGVYDMTTTIDFILKETRQSKVDIVGYSLGTTIALVGLSDRPEYNAKINKLVLMAPTSRLKTPGIPLSIINQYSPFVTAVLNAVKFFPYTEDPDTSYQLIRDMCKNKSMFAFCRAFIDFAQGIKLPIHNETIIDAVSFFPQPMSSKILKHYVQFITSGRFCHYNYGPSGNMLHYGRRTAPDYDLSKVIVPTYVVHSMNDTLVPPKDVKWLITQLPNVKGVKYIDKIPFGHLSFSLSPIMKEVVNSYIAEKLLERN